MLLEEFDYPLSHELIASRPLGERDASRMMVVERTAGAHPAVQDRRFRDLPQVLRPGDLLVLNNTKVFPARLLGRRQGVKAQPIGKRNPAAREHLSSEIELLLTRQETPASRTGRDEIWQALVRPGRKVRTGEVLVFGEGALEAEVVGRGKYGARRVRLRAREGSLSEAIDRLGHVPIPAYIHRPDEPADRERYQTVYARVRGSVAAPTAGFHFTAQILEELRRQGIETCEITLHVGPGTFQPVRAATVEEHKMGYERFEIPEGAADAVNRALAEGRRVIAVGTTTVRTLEHVAREQQGRIVPGSGETDLFILPGFEFRVTKALLTNFHLPRSTLLILVCAFARRELILQAYRHAIDERYRFYSYGDCMLLL